jgi:hypothetical protein
MIHTSVVAAGAKAVAEATTSAEIKALNFMAIIQLDRLKVVRIYDK